MNHENSIIHRFFPLKKILFGRLLSPTLSGVPIKRIGTGVSTGVGNVRAADKQTVYQAVYRMICFNLVCALASICSDQAMQRFVDLIEERA